MNFEQNNLLLEILLELKAITLELQYLRKELQGKSINDTSDLTNHTELPKSTVETPQETQDSHAFTVYDWLTAKGITVKNYREQGAEDTVFDQLAFFLGERFGNLVRVHELIRRNLTGNGFILNLSSASQAEISDTTQFCTMLSKFAFLSSYKYIRNTKTIHATPQRLGKVINFFTGGWFERYIYLKILNLLLKEKLQFTCLLNPKITFSNGDDFELDLLFLIDKQPLWIECKTGDYQAYITKYSEARKMLSIPKQRAILIILGITNELAQNLTYLYDITVANENNFLERINEILGGSAPTQKQEPIEGPMIPNVEIDTPTSGPQKSVLSLLNKAGLRPMPEYRQQVICELINVVESSSQPMNMIEVKGILATRVPISKSQLQDILRAIVNSGCILDNDGQIVSSFNSPFIKLISNQLEVIEDKCIESYVRAVLRSDLGYFDDPDKVSEFEQTVGGKIPPMEKIRDMGKQPQD